MVIYCFCASCFCQRLNRFEWLHQIWAWKPVKMPRRTHTNSKRHRGKKKHPSSVPDKSVRYGYNCKLTYSVKTVRRCYDKTNSLPRRFSLITFCVSSEFLTNFESPLMSTLLSDISSSDSKVSSSVRAWCSLTPKYPTVAWNCCKLPRVSPRACSASPSPGGPRRAADLQVHCGGRTKEPALMAFSVHPAVWDLFFMDEMRGRLLRLHAYRRAEDRRPWRIDRRGSVRWGQQEGG